jgi:hypothetical protein
MIKVMESANVRIERNSDTLVTLTVNGKDMALNIDELNEIVRMTEHFWSINNLYNFTTEAKKERERWENESLNMPKIAQGAFGRV